MCESRVVFRVFRVQGVQGVHINADRDVTLTGFCDRTLSFGAVSIDFLQEFDISAHRAWNSVVAVVSVHQPGHVLAHLTRGTNRANEQWFFFCTPSMSQGMMEPGGNV
jgi:hypothetical protein